MAPAVLKMETRKQYNAFLTHTNGLARKEYAKMTSLHSYANLAEAERKMGGGGEPRLKDHFDDHGQIRCFKNSTILLLLIPSSSPLFRPTYVEARKSAPVHYPKINGHNWAGSRVAN